MLSQVRLQADARFPWIVLIPERSGLRELDQLAPEDVQVLTGEIIQAGAAVRTMGEALGRRVEKLNLGALGNIVAQLHVHVVGRRADDPAWPGPVWGFGEAEPYVETPLATALAAARAAFGEALRP